MGSAVARALLWCSPEDSVGVQRVLSPCDVFQVVEAVIVRVPVDMVNFLTFRATACEGHHYEPMNRMQGGGVVRTQMDSQVAPVCHNLANLDGSPYAGSHSPEVANVVAVLESWYWQPSLTISHA